MASISGAFGVLVFLLAIVGLHSVVMYAVSQRTREFAVRIALGARPADIVRGVMGQSLRMTALGVVAGGAVATALVYLMRGFLFGVSPFDPLTFAGGALLLGVVAVVAAYLPARRATRIDPAAALWRRS